MKKGAGLINAARGGVIDEEALLNALDNEQLSFAGLDTFVNEPNPAMKVLMHPSVSLTPHIGAATQEAQDRIGTELAQQIHAILGEPDEKLKTTLGDSLQLPLVDYFHCLWHYRQCIGSACRTSYPLAGAYSRKYQSMAILADPYLIDFSNLPGDFGCLWLFIWRVPIFLEL